MRTLSVRPLLLLHVALVIVGSALTACSRATESAPDAPEGVESSTLAECRAFLASYGACMRSLSPQSPDLVAVRITSATESLNAMHDREQAARACSSGAARLNESCR
jgi:hypothetical protein